METQSSYFKRAHFLMQQFNIYKYDNVAWYYSRIAQLGHHVSRWCFDTYLVPGHHIDLRR